MSEAINKLVSNKDLCLKMGLASRKRVEENFTLEHFGKEMERIYKKILEEKTIKK